MIKRYEHNEWTLDKASVMGILESTLRIIRKQAEKIKENCKSSMRMMANKITPI
jgi:hypothetical protein